MKQNFDTSALRQTAAEIQGAVKPKSITPDMVGGLFSALVEAQGEVIEALAALEREVVTVKVNGYDGEQRVSAAGAKVYVDIFSIGGVPTVALPRQELTADANGVVTFEVFKGYQYAVFSKIEGLGASFQFTYTAGIDARNLDLWCFPTGVYVVGYSIYYDDDAETSRLVPCVGDNWDNMNWEWDVQNAEYADEYYMLGVLVSATDTSFAIEENSRAEDTLRWTNTRMFTQEIPTLPSWYKIANDDYEAAYNLARTDYDGNLNTAKILAFCKDAPAADFCANIEGYEFRQVFLPSAGQLYLMYQNRAAINAIMEGLNDSGWNFTPIDTLYYWSSSQANVFCAWFVIMYNGDTNDYIKYNSSYVRAVSAFHFIY